MFVNRINNNHKVNTNFKSFQHEIDNVGNRVLRFNYVYDYNTKNAEIEIYKVKENNNSYAGYEVLKDNLLAKYKLDKNGTVINLDDIIDLKKNEPFAYRIVIDGENSIADSGIKLDWNAFTLVTRKGTTPKTQGAAYLAFPDSQRVGVKYRDFNDANTGMIYIDNTEQKEFENATRTFSNKFGGNLAGLEYNLDYLANNGYKIQLTNPICGGDDKSSHRYWNKNNFQISDDMGNMENIASYARKLFQKGLVYVYDGTFTSEGLEGIHFQYALRWAEKNPQTYYWFKMQGLENENIGLGVIPKNKENLRHRVINSPVIYNELTNKIEKNLSYNPNKETYFQIYDGSQVSEHQLSKLDKPIENYEKIKSNNLLAINNHNDTLINYVFQIDTKEYINRLKTFIEFNKNNNKPLKLNSPEGTIFIGQFSNFKIDAKTEGGVVTWDANTDMIKLNYFISGYDEKLNQAKNSATQKDYETKMRIRGAYEVQDMTLQAGRYWTKTFSNIQKIYIAQVLKGCNSSEKLINLINNGLLPKEAFLNQETIENILNGFYNLNPKGLLAKDDTTLKAIMDFPLESLEFAENTVGVLSTSYFSNRAIDEKTLGLTRYELFTNDNPHLVEPYKKNYENINSLFKYDIKEFANKIIEKLNETSSEKLLDKNNNYTEYGEYIIELMGNSITKYAFLKSLAGDKLKTKILPNGEITYDYKHLKDITTLKSLGIDGVSPKDEAQQLTNLITEGIKNLNDSDINYIVKSLENRIKDTNVNSFRLSEAIFNNSGLGLAWRLDAMKDITDQDSLRNKETSFDKNWNNVIKFWSNFVQVVKKESPDSYIIAEITDLDALMRDNYGENINAYDNNMPMENAKYKNVNDALIKFYNETGITSEAAYSSFFTDLIKVFAPEFENGTSIKDTTRIHNFANKFVELINTRSSNFTRNLYTFVGNHDKPRIIHGLALDMNLFHSNLSIFKSGNDINYLTNREPRIKSLIQLTNSDNYESLPLEAKLNVDNPDYFRTTSTYAVAMSQLLRDSLNNCKSIINNPNQIKYLKLALVDLTNGNYLGNGSSIKIPSINIPELSSAENLLNLILEKSHIQLSPNEITAILNQTKNLEFVNQFNIQGDFNWDIDENNAYIGKKNKKLLESILRGSAENQPIDNIDYNKYSLYTVAAIALIRQAFMNIKGNDIEAQKAFLDSSKEIVKYYDKNYIKDHQTPLPLEEKAELANAKIAYGSKDIKVAIEMMVNQAEYLAQQDGTLKSNENFTNREELILNIWKNATEPAVQKAFMIMSFLSATMGIPTIYGGDELGMSGYEEKAKNVTLQNRNALIWSELENGPFKNYRTKIQNMMNKAMQIRSKDGLQALNKGTAYEIKTSDNNIPALLMQDAYGNMTISIFNATDINTNPKFNYFEYFKINDKNKENFFNENDIESINKDNPYVPIQQTKNLDYLELAEGLSLPIGLTFINSDIKDKASYIIEKFENKYRLVKKGGGKISLKNNVMILKHVAFKGNNKNINKQYIINQNIYKNINNMSENHKFSIVST